jgi:hypothetical protein
VKPGTSSISENVSLRREPRRCSASWHDFASALLIDERGVIASLPGATRLLTRLGCAQALRVTDR